MSYSTWGESKDRAPTTWGADWDYFSIADRVVIILSPSLCCILEVSIITISHFQYLCPYESYQYFKFSYHINGHHFLARTNNDLSLIINSDKEWFVWRTSLKHVYPLSISWGFCIVFTLHYCYCYFFPEFRVSFSSRS